MEVLSQSNRYILFQKEAADIDTLKDMIKEAKWVDNNTIFVNCFPEYSSFVTQMLNHKLSFINKHELFEVINLSMPYSNMSQVWDPEDRNYKMYIKYLAEWVRKNINGYYKYLFVGALMNNSNFARLRSILKGKLEPESYRIAVPYLSNEVKNYITPDFFVEAYDGNIIFQWENMNNPDKK